MLRFHHRVVPLKVKRNLRVSYAANLNLDFTFNKKYRSLKIR
jgi:hypothetical protein